MKNFSSETCYGITNNGSLFTLLPEACSYVGVPQSGLTNGIYVDAKVIVDPSPMTPIQTVSNKMYNPPLPNYPLYIEEHNCILFATADERQKAIDMYQDAEKLVKCYATGMVNIINACYKAITCLNVDKSFYTLSSNGITEIPTPPKEYVKEMCRQYKITPEQLETNDVFVINTIVKSNGGPLNKRETVVSTTVKCIEKAKMLKGQPVLFETDGMLVFDGRNQVESFINKYGTVGNYLIQRALEATKSIHESEIADINEQVSKDKRGMLETFSLMSVTSIASILTENVIKSYNDDDTGEATKKAFKILGLGAIAIGTGIGLYKLFRKLTDDKKSK